jgi:hypothetical protein
MPAKKSAKKTARDSKGNPVALHSKTAEAFKAANDGLANRLGDEVHGSMKKERQARHRVRK